MELIPPFFFFFSKILPKFEFEVNFSVQLYASLTREDPAYFQITYHYVYELRYAQLKSFYGHRVSAPKPIYRLLNPFGHAFDPLSANPTK